MRESDFRTAYSADRAAALAGIPEFTLHYWARTLRLNRALPTSG